MSTKERSLGDVVDTTPPITPQNFDITAFVQGWRPYRRSVRMYAAGDLIGQLNILAGLIDAAGDDTDVDALIDEFERIRAQFQEPRWFTVEKRSVEWVAHFWTRAEVEIGAQRVDGKLTPDDTRLIALHQMVAQIVNPTGVTVEHLQAILAEDPSALDELTAAILDVNKTRPQDAEVLTRDFSRKRSAKKPTRTG